MTHLTQSKLKAPVDDKIKVTQELKFISIRVENITGKGEHAGKKHVILFQKCFQKASSSGRTNQGLYGKRLDYLSQIYGTCECQFE